MNEPDESVRDALSFLMEREDWNVIKVLDCTGLKRATGEPGVVGVISEASLPDCTPGEVLEHCKERNLPVIFIGHNVPLQEAVDLIRKGAMDFLDKPFPQTRLLDLLDRMNNRQNK